jgi:cobalt-zinc-cadmium efflux system protein
MAAPHAHTHDHPERSLPAHRHAHAHDHSGHTHGHHGHAHHAVGETSIRRLATVLALTTTFMVVEAVAGWWTNSLALLSDAGHMLTDVGALGLALFALWFSRRAAPRTLTFGYLRFEILAALINGVALLAITGYIFYEAWNRIHAPAEVRSAPMLVVAVLGLLVNLVSLFVLSRGGGHSLNERGALLHVMGDMLGSVGAITAALVIQFTGWQAADPIASAVIGLLILRSTWELLRETVNILMEGTPIHLSFDEVHGAMLTVPGVTGVHDLHLWSLASGFDALSAHVVVPDSERSDAVRGELRALLSEQFNIRHTTLEIQRPGETADGPPGMEGRCRAWPC